MCYLYYQQVIVFDKLFWHVHLCTCHRQYFVWPNVSFVDKTVAMNDVLNFGLARPQLPQVRLVVGIEKKEKRRRNEQSSRFTVTYNYKRR